MGEGGCSLPELRHSGLETMSILGGSDVMQQLFEERAHASQENTVSSLLISIENEPHHEGLWRAPKKAVISKLC